MEHDQPYLEGYIIQPDQVYGFDYAVYKQGSTDYHTHSVALIKKIEDEAFGEVEKWLKICNSVRKELWLWRGNMIYPVRLRTIG